MNRSAITPRPESAARPGGRKLRPFALAAAALLLGGCFPSTGEIQLYVDGPAGNEAGAQDGGGERIIITEDGPTQPPADGAPPQLDSASPPDSAPTSPSPPFGTTVGMTAPNFTQIPDCAGTMVELYSYFQQKKGVLIAMMSPS